MTVDITEFFQVDPVNDFELSDHFWFQSISIISIHSKLKID